jgi:phosphoribosylformimino-5-aminoimidazole carboxamide ribotide isomerase
MTFIPAIDLLGGRTVRLDQGDYGKVTAYPDDPAEAAAAFREDGASRIHVVDLDAARSGGDGNIAVIRRIAAGAGVPVQVGGGVRDEGRIAALLDAGVDRVVVGTLLVKNQPLAVRLAKRYGDRLIAGIDAREGVVRVAGWTEGSTVTAVDLAKTVSLMGFPRLIYTDISRDGMLSGPNIDAIGAVAHAGGIPVTAAGGVGSIEHLKMVASLAAGGVEGVIAGKAIYEGRIDVRTACALLSGV